ncbi:MAG TPA: hypothetical protein DDZ83_04695 [Nitrospinae bacterium]|nr:hypothetical protein [Nitrospinota bacterium]
MGRGILNRGGPRRVETGSGTSNLRAFSVVFISAITPIFIALVEVPPARGGVVFREGRFQGIGVTRKFGLAFSLEGPGFGRFREFAADGLTYVFAGGGRSDVFGSRG